VRIIGRGSEGPNAGVEKGAENWRPNAGASVSLAIEERRR